MTPRRDIRSPHFDDRPIPVEFVLLHYTAGDLEASIPCFFAEARPVSCHLLIAEDGDLYEIVECWDGICKRAWHAGLSRYSAGGKSYEGFNDFALGIEIVNVNGNLVPYTDMQYRALCQVLVHLKELYPALHDPERILGHEHVAAWRGKADPGRHFDWHRVFSTVYPGQPPPARPAVCPDLLAETLARFLRITPSTREESALFWHAVSATTEVAVGYAMAAVGGTGSGT